MNLQPMCLEPEAPAASQAPTSERRPTVQSHHVRDACKAPGQILRRKEARSLRWARRPPCGRRPSPGNSKRCYGTGRVEHRAGSAARPCATARPPHRTGPMGGKPPWARTCNSGLPTAGPCGIRALASRHGCVRARCLGERATRAWLGMQLANRQLQSPTRWPPPLVAARLPIWCSGCNRACGPGVRAGLLVRGRRAPVAAYCAACCTPAGAAVGSCRPPATPRPAARRACTACTQCPPTRNDPNAHTSRARGEAATPFGVCGADPPAGGSGTAPVSRARAS